MLEGLAQARLARVVALRLLVDLDAGLAREGPKGLGKRDAIALHDEAEDVAAQAAPKALPGLARGGDHERGGLLTVEGAEPLERGSGLLQLDGLAHNVDDAELVLDLGCDACCRDGT